MMFCHFCFNEGTFEDGSFDPDGRNEGYWCDICDAYNYLDETKRGHHFTLVLEDKISGKNISVEKTKKFSKQLSPYRYPGGKSKIIDYLYTLIKKEKTKRLVSPFTGGGSFELAMLEAEVVDELHLNDLDTGVFSLWWVMKHMPYALISRIETEIPTHKDYFRFQNAIKNDYKNMDMVDAAWASLVVNRLAFSGVSKANPLGGKKGDHKKLLSRWNPKRLIKRIEKVHYLSDRITITQESAVELIEEAYWNDETTIFVDPPYVDKGKDLYHCYYENDDHIELAVLLDSLYHGCPGADIIVTYDYNEWLDSLYHYPQSELINRNYSA